MIISVGGFKGGVGKTTIATNLAVILSLEGHDTLLVDADNNGSSSFFTELRAESQDDPGYTLARLVGKEIQTQVPRLAKKYDHVVIDIGAQDTSSQRAAMVISDVFLLPCPPRSYDLNTFDRLDEVIGEAKISNPNLKAFSFLNLAYPNNKDNDEAADLLKEGTEIGFLETQLVQRKAFSDTIPVGQSVVEQDPVNPKAVGEIRALFKRILNQQSVISVVS